MNKLTNEDKVLLIFVISVIWCSITSLAGHSELWVIPMMLLTTVFCIHLILSLIRDIYFARRRERLYERRYWNKYKED